MTDPAFDPRELPEWVQQQIDADDPLPPPWSVRRRLAFGVAVAALLWAILIFAAIGVVAVFGHQL